jgi:hypothetical protein
MAGHPGWSVSPLVGRETIVLCAVPSGFFGILFGLRYVVVSQDAGSTLLDERARKEVSLLLVVTLQSHGVTRFEKRLQRLDDRLVFQHLSLHPGRNPGQAAAACPAPG